MAAGGSHLIITSMKNEASFILEWLAYHRLIGFTDFLVYTNDCEDSTVEMLVRLQELGLVVHEPNKVLRRGPHKSALKAAKEHALARSADWILILDIDEFLNIKVGDGTIEALIDHVPPDTDVIPVTWRLFSHGDQVAYRDKPVIEIFTDAERPLADGGMGDRFVKSLFRRQDCVERFGIHGPKTPETFVWRQPDGRLLGSKDNRTRPEAMFCYDVAQINHYAVGTVDGFLVKKDRGRANHWRQDLGIDYWRRLCRGGEEDRTILKWRDAVEAEVARLKADDRLRALHEAGVAWRQQRIADLREEPRFEKMRDEILALSKKRDHHRTHDAPETEQEPTDIMARLETLCRDMRQLVEQVTPHDAAERAHDGLDRIETVLFGKVRSE